MNQEFNEDLLEILACPKCNRDIEYVKQVQQLKCAKCQLEFPIADNIPNMIIDEKS